MILCIVHLAAMFPNNKATGFPLEENIQCEQFMVCGKLILMEGIRQDVNPEKVVLTGMVPCGIPGDVSKTDPKKSIDCHGADVQHGAAGRRRHMEAPDSTVLFWYVKPINRRQAKWNLNAHVDISPTTSRKQHQMGCVGV